ncbi:hypothetical protein OAK48_01975 [Deltaproteobacteria bacterium]|nr:hypothetical protein [Deltaproteobacteria bacterium]
MFKRILFLWLICIIIVVLSSGCAISSIGKVDLSSRTVPGFLRTGTTSIEDVLENIGEPFGYREQGNRSAMIYLSFQEDYFNLLFTQIRMEESHRLDLVFNKNILEKAEIKKEGWGFGVNIDPQLIHLLGQ